MRRMNSFQRQFLYLFSVISLFLLSTSLFFQPAEARGREVWREIKARWPKLWVEKRPCRVERAVDGDTVILRCGRKRVRVRLLGIDTPETKHPFKPVEYFGPEASKKAKELLYPNRRVWLAYPRSKRRSRGFYGRLLAYLFFADTTMYNAEMIRLGYAFALRRYPHVYMKEFIALEEEARRARRGMWKNPDKVAERNALDRRYRQKKRECIEKLGRPRKFEWVIGDTSTRYYYTSSHPSYFQTNPYTRVLFCSEEEARRAGYRPAPLDRESRRGGGLPSRPKESVLRIPVGPRPTPLPSAGGEESRRPKPLPSRGSDEQRSRPRPLPSPRGAFDSPPPIVPPIILVDTKTKTYRVYPGDRFKIFNSEAEAIKAGFRRFPPAGGVSVMPFVSTPCPKGQLPIVGNKRSKVYRLPSQRSYRRALRSKNAVFFCSEEEAIKAGYRKAKR